MIFSFDAETDGLYGEAFAIAAIVMDDAGTVLDSFSGMADVASVQDEWTLQNCVPYLGNLPAYRSRRELRGAFWAFYLKYREQCVIVSDVPFPVEAQLMRQCVEADAQNTFLGPYPLIDVASVFYARGLDPLTDRLAYSGYAGERHDPLTDATASALCLIKLMKTPLHEREGTA